MILIILSFVLFSSNYISREEHLVIIPCIIAHYNFWFLDETCSLFINQSFKISFDFSVRITYLGNNEIE